MKQKSVLKIIALLALGLALLQPIAAQQAQKDNPFFQARTTPFQVPPFDKIVKVTSCQPFRKG